MPAEVLVTRNLRSFKILSTYVAGVQRRLFALLAEQPQLIAAFTCCLTPSHDLESTLAHYFADPPHIALVQGLGDPATIPREARLEGGTGVGGQRAASLHSTTSSTNTGNSWTETLAPGGVENLVFLPWALHSAMETARQEKDETALGEAAMMSLVALIYETAHWMYEKTRGYEPQTSVRSMTDLDPAELERIVASRKETDVGLRVLALLLGADFELVVFADGNSALVKQRLPAPHPPLIHPSVLPELLGVDDIPTAVDITAYGPSRIGKVPRWRKDEVFPVVKVEAVGGACHHGKCSL